VKAPGFGDSRRANLDDLATLTGGEVVFYPDFICHMLHLGSHWVPSFYFSRF